VRQPIRFRRLDDNQFKRFSDFPRQGSDGLSLVQRRNTFGGRRVIYLRR
jgi:hypothetical protein